MALPRWGPLVELAGLAAASWPFAQAVTILRRFGGALVSPEWVRQVAHAQGLARSQPARDEAQAVVESRVDGVPTRSTDRVGCPVEVDGEHPARELSVALAGGWVKSREQPGGMAGTVGVLTTGRLPTSPTRGKLLARRLVATVCRGGGDSSPHTIQGSCGDPSSGALAYREAARLGVEQAQRVMVLGDGALGGPAGAAFAWYLQNQRA